MKTLISKSFPTILFVFVYFVLFFPCHVAGSSSGKGTISGSVKVKPDKSNEITGIVAFFNVELGPPSGQDNNRRVPDHLTQLEKDSRFTAKLIPGKYYVGVILGRSLKSIGPPKKGEHSFTAFNEQGDPQIFIIEAETNTDTGELSGKMPLGLRRNFEMKYFTVKGVIRDENGKPVEGAKIIAFREGDKIRKPITTFQGTDKDGKYALTLSPGSKYNLSVRAGYGGGQPVSGEYIGRLGDANIAAITGKEGQVIYGINITVYTIPERNPEQKINPLRKKKTLQKKMSPELDAEPK
ncbi:MAG: carboxypeptidase-like regulatory domain-containing protein [Proteobacteria bacterium]|nr:carboxypeptidase-like regulatory domain-containing protein [Pseudomonadota bacterium]MBU1708467.1 carboxypeptidase-like regulatory domain-containing protein [Pseudomonadota bacterium]